MTDNYQLPLNEIYLGDCIKLLKKLPDESVDLVVSSPPYNLGKEYEAKQALEIYLQEQTVILRECSRVLKSTGSLFWQIGAFSNKGMLIPLDIRFFPILESCELIPKNRIVWARQHGLHARKKFSCRHETLLWFTKSDNYIFNLDGIRVPQKYQNKKHYRGNRKGELSCNPNGKNPGDIWLFRNVKHNHEEQTIHPCQFPEDMIARIILSTTNKNDIVLDPYMGSGTVAVVAQDYERYFIGAELEPKYHQVALRRLSKEPDQNECFPNLKTLRDYVEETGETIEKFRFDMQVAKKASERSKAKIYSEEYHLQEMEDRLLYEEAAFAANLRGEEPPIDRKPNGNGKKTPIRKQDKVEQIQLNLWD
ncbi:MAG: site-specific DNA-methyltransferase [Rivularia sp. (in: Bacteria)]|nr:site-specific DNA-methyltransferase [Rivularia sp. MS3]